MKNNFVLSSHITGVFDVNRNRMLNDDDFSIISAWANSVSAQNLKGIIFHNNFSAATCKANQNEYISFIKIDYDAKYNPNVFRYFIYDQFFKTNAHIINNVFLTDVSDVVVLKNPFLDQLYLENPTAIFCGDETKILDNQWMQEHAQHLRNKIPDYAAYETKFKTETLLNCGIIGGKIEILQPFINQLWAIHNQFNNDNNTSYTGDMGAFNYLIRTKYNNKVIHGKPVNTEFKKEEFDATCWFKHK